MSSIALISLLNLQLFPTAVRIGVTIWMIPLKSYHSEAISKTSSSFAGWKKPSTIFNCSCKDITQHQKKVFSLLYCWLKCKKPVGNDEHCASNIAVHKINPLKPFYIFLDQEKNNEHKSNEIREPACFPKYTLDYRKHKRLRNRRTVQKNAFFHTYFKGSLCFLSPAHCDYLFICLLICFSLPRV